MPNKRRKGDERPQLKVRQENTTVRVLKGALVAKPLFRSLVVQPDGEPILFLAN